MLILKNGNYVMGNQDQTVCETVISYEAMVVSQIRQKYTLDEELAVLRQRDSKPEEFNTYFNYCEECKARAKQEG